MYAVIQTGGKQYRVKEGDVIDIEKIPIFKTKKEVTFSDVLLSVEKKDVTVGQPIIKGAKVKAEFVDSLRSKKIVTYKYKRRKNSHKTIGHRQDLIRLRIKEISLQKQ
ncbi:50S ribosomal protein L21 [Candidatus Omnitrophota bacterium]